MLPGYEKKSNYKVLLAIALGILTGILMLLTPQSAGTLAEPILLTLTVVLMGFTAVFWYWGLGCYLVGKGYSAVIAAVGLLGLIGLLIILVLPDKHNATTVMEQQ